MQSGLCSLPSEDGAESRGQGGHHPRSRVPPVPSTCGPLPAALRCSLKRAQLWDWRAAGGPRLIALEMAKIHTIHTNGSLPKPTLWHKMHNYFTLVRNEINPSLSAGVPKVEVLEWELAWLKEHLSQLDSPVVFCHNDLLCKNIIYDSAKGHVRFIDYEYAGYNYQAFDIGNHFNEFAGVNEVDYCRYPARETQLQWLHYYLQAQKDSAVTPREVERLYVQVNKFALVRSDPIQPVLQGEASSLGLGDAKVTSLARLPGQLCSPGPALLRGSRPWTRGGQDPAPPHQAQEEVPAASRGQTDPAPRGSTPVRPSPLWNLGCLRRICPCLAWGQGALLPPVPQPPACLPLHGPHQHQPALSDGGGGQNRAAPFSEALSSSPPPPPSPAQGGFLPTRYREPKDSGGLPIVPREGTGPCSCSTGQAPLPGLPWKKTLASPLSWAGQSLRAEVTPAAL
uniref:ethanolamine kinase n=1 Tax=Oryctolagus cuniculus TaxID=9986 RepID=A0A5F9D697_RABIT